MSEDVKEVILVLNMIEAKQVRALVTVETKQVRALVTVEKGRASLKTINSDYLNVMKWVKQNLKYCFFHSDEKVIKLVEKALKAGIPSYEYRTKHPFWEKEN